LQDGIGAGGRLRLHRLGGRGVGLLEVGRRGAGLTRAPREEQRGGEEARAGATRHTVVTGGGRARSATAFVVGARGGLILVTGGWRARSETAFRALATGSR